MWPYPIIQLGNGQGIVYLYGVMIAVGLLAAFAVLFYYSKKLKIQEKFTDFIFYDAIASVVVGFGSAALFQATYDFIENPAAGFHITEKITFIGGLIGGAICFLAGYFIFGRRYESKLTDSISIIPCAILIGHAFGRIGCFFAGCCYGKPTDSFLGVKFPNLDHAVHPTMLYEAAFLLVLFAICTFLLFKFKFRHNLSVYLVGYGIFRFFNEYLRGDDARGEFVPGMSPSQFWSLLMVVAGFAVFIGLELYWRKHPKKVAASELESSPEAETAEKSSENEDE